MKKKTTLSSTQAAAKRQAKKNEERVLKEETKPAKAKCKPATKTCVRKRKAKLPQSPVALSKEEVKELLAFIVQKLDDGKAENIVTIDLKGKSSFTDYLVIANGNSSRHLNGLANNLIQDIKKAGFRARISGDTSDSGWIVIDLIDVMVHLFTGVWKNAN